jgi:TPR repeat protein/putative methionine-R-sulfoxide reductase with GAF domain
LDFDAFVGLKQRLERLASEDRNASLRAIAERALILTRSTGAAIALLQGEEMVCVATSGSNAPSLGARLKVGSGFSGECARSARLLRCDDSECDERVDRESCNLLGIRSMVAVPLMSQERVTALLEVCSPDPNNFSANDEMVLSTLAAILETVLSRSAASPATSNLNGEPFQEILTRVQRAQSSALLWDARQQVADSTFPKKKISSALTWFVAVNILVLALAFWLVWHRVEFWKGISNLGISQSQSGLLDNTADVSRPPTIQTHANDLASIRQMAEEGDPAAQFALGAKFAIGEGVPQNYSDAARWFGSAAEQGHTTAQTILASYYAMGRGVRKDLSKAYFWSVLAQAGGEPSSRYRLSILSSRMTPSQVLAAQQQANDWLRQRRQLRGKLVQDDKKQLVRILKGH